MDAAPSEKVETNSSFVGLAADIVAAYVSKNAITTADLPALIMDVYKSIAEIGTGAVEPPPAPPREPAISIKKSITPDFIICLEDGKKFKSLKRHLTAAYGLTPQDYRRKWGLPPDYPMVAPSYSKARSELAKHAGLGSKVQRRPKLAKISKKTTRKTT